MTDPKPGAGDIEIELCGETKILKSCYAAYRDICSACGDIGVTQVMQKLVDGNINTLEIVLAAGLQLTPHGRKGLGEKIFKSDPSELFTPAIRFVGTLQRGGRPIDESDDGGEETGDPQN